MKILTEFEATISAMSGHNIKNEDVRVTAAYSHANVGSVTFDIPAVVARELHIGQRILMTPATD
jgi:hypothetical protein